MLNSRLKAISTADLILELQARGRDTSSLIAEIQAERIPAQQDTTSPKVISIKAVRESAARKI